MRRTRAWAAGLFEGEGSIARREGNRVNHLWQVTLTSTDHDVVLAFHEVVEVGRIYGPYQPKRPGSKLYWRWTVSDRLGIEAFAKMIGPYLLSRRRARLAECLAGIAETPFTRKPHRRKQLDN